MSATQSPVIRCPVCDADGTLLHHDMRALLVYSCLQCLHEWEIDPADEPAQSDPTVAERARTPTTGRKLSHRS
jgi:hypothetical protein